MKKIKSKIINYDDELYPKLLKEIDDPPKQLHVLGNEELLREKSISIIGSRACSDSGRNIAKEFASELSSYGICITSGMALGIDAAAHFGALESSKKTIAVLGCGVDVVYPPQNKGLYHKILDNRGLIISEYEDGTEPEGARFVERNRIVSGLSIGTLVVEAKHRSGTSITASLAKSQGRKVFCIPHGIDDNTGTGTNKLLNRGAICVTTPEHILNEFPEFSEIVKQIDNKDDEIIKTSNLEFMSEEFKKVYLILNKNPVHINYIYKNVNMSVNEINSILTMLELEGYIVQLPGKEFIIT